MKDCHTHFSRVARCYRDLRTTDNEPILYIVRKLPQLPQLVAADFGCGTGRYSLKLCKKLGERLFLYCVDNNRDMLRALQTYFQRHGLTNYRVLHNHAEERVLKANSLHFVVTFNAIHHFQISAFFQEVLRILREDGLLFIYTRFRSQNQRNIWGRFFPGFAEKETRLYELSELQRKLAPYSELVLEEVKYFKFPRQASIHWLLKQAQNHHYSTFYLYEEEEFRIALQTFKRNLEKHYPDLSRIHWQDENVMLTIRKRSWN